MEANQSIQVEPGKLDVIVKQSGLEIQEGEAVKQSYLPFLEQLAEIREEAKKINFADPKQLDEGIARTLRLRTVKVRTDAEKLKDARKRTYLLKGNLEQASYNLIAATCKLAEDVFVNVEKAREIAEAKRVEQLRVERVEELSRYDWMDNAAVNVGKLDENTYNAMLAGIKKQYEDRKEAERKEEEERLAKIEAERIENERIRKENERLAKEAAEKEAQLIAEREKAERERREAEEKARKEREAIEAKAKAEREKAEKEAAEKLAAERKERERVEAELRAKKEAEEAEKKRIEEEEQARIAAEKKAAAAPDKLKLSSAIQNVSLTVAELKTDAAKEVKRQLSEKLESYKEWAAKLINTL
jgi:chemotaxis protein histidine kinase CheA